MYKSKLRSLCVSLLSVAILLMSVPFTVSAQEYTEGLWRYRENMPDDGVTIIKYTGLASEVVIPSQLGGEDVTVIGSEAFTNNIDIKEVIIPITVKKICARAFYQSGLQSLTIPDNVTTIESYYAKGTFENCKNLYKVDIGDGLKEIGNSCFSGCSKLKDVKLGDNLSRIGENAFLDCNALSEVTMKNSVEEIGPSCFQNCISLKNIVLSKRLSKIGYSAFYQSGLQSLTIPDSVIEIDSIWSRGTFENCEKLEKVVLGNHLKKIGVRSFYDCKNLKNVSIGYDLSEIGEDAFRNCTALTSVSMGNNVKIIADNCFKDCISLKNVIWSKKLLEIGYGSFYHTGLKEAVLPGTVVNLGNSWSTPVFGACDQLKTIVLPNSVTAVGTERITDQNSNTVIKGYAGSYAESYAKENQYAFQRLTAVPVTKISFPMADLSIKLDQTVTLAPFFAPVDMTDALLWKSGDEELLTVNQAGEITGKKVGNVVVKVTTTSGKSAEIEVHITNEEVIRIGDLDNDSRISLKDVLSAQKYLSKIVTLSGEQILSGDANNDGQLTVEDVLLIQKHLANITDITIR